MARTRGTATRRSRRLARASLARRADRYELYQKAVQDPEGDVARLRRIFRRHYGREPERLREDFCGTAALACAWVASHHRHEAVAIDLDPEPLAWCRRHGRARLRPDQAKRLTLVRGDVRRVERGRFDVVVAFNFSYFLFDRRDTLRAYFRAVRRRLHREGLFVLDAYGGPEAQEQRVERRRVDGFTYVWDQARFDPVSHHATCYIHFEFRDGSRLARAFRYDWRLWTLPELRELLDEAGFGSVQVYWEGTDRRTHEPNGVFRPVREAPEDPAWVALLVARP